MHERLCLAVVLILVLGVLGVRKERLLPREMQDLRVHLPTKDYLGRYSSRASQHWAPAAVSTSEKLTVSELHISAPTQVQMVEAELPIPADSTSQLDDGSDVQHEEGS